VCDRDRLITPMHACNRGAAATETKTVWRASRITDHSGAGRCCARTAIADRRADRSAGADKAAELDRANQHCCQRCASAYKRWCVNVAGVVADCATTVCCRLVDTGIGSCSCSSSNTVIVIADVTESAYSWRRSACRVCAHAAGQRCGAVACASVAAWAAATAATTSADDDRRRPRWWCACDVRRSQSVCACVCCAVCV
jgi:hypothetical protein